MEPGGDHHPGADPAPELRLYDNAYSVAAQKVRIVLDEKGLPFTSVPIDLRNGEAMAPEYLRLNAGGVVPTLACASGVLVESSVIVEYLDDRWPDPPLRPGDPFARAMMRRWMKRMDDDVHRATGHLSMAIYLRHAHLAKPSDERERYFARMPDRDRAERQMTAIMLGTDAPGFAPSVRLFARIVDEIDAQLQATGRTWLAGEAFSLADASVAPYMTRLALLTDERLWHDGRRPAFQRWWRSVQERGSFRRQVRDAYDAPAVAFIRAKAEDAWPVTERILAPDRTSSGDLR